MMCESDFQEIQNFKKRCGGRYKLGVDLGMGGEVVGYYILTKFPKRDTAKGEVPFQVYEFSPDILHALIPRRTADALLKKHTCLKFYIDAGPDGIILSFPAHWLPELETDLRLRRRRRLSPEQREKAAERLRQHQFKPHVESEKGPDFER